MTVDRHLTLLYKIGMVIQQEIEGLITVPAPDDDFGLKHGVSRPMIDADGRDGVISIAPREFTNAQRYDGHGNYYEDGSAQLPRYHNGRYYRHGYRGK